ncbi:zinc finger BED domain-containing protein 5 [Trichonephila clavata]|uniref:Zinc finger BED domain-containing protein 5 n=1 Tax=Trichonephila clavata TaxID=2740835 RepID=A0A8X6FK13_TRICU|nr:zinc finger BED domain-containing protein 5 [Trichonephila clavata]
MGPLRKLTLLVVMQKSRNLQAFWNPQCHQLPVPYRYSLFSSLYHIPISDRWYQRKEVNIILGYLSFGFSSTGDEEAPDAVCLLCNKILANSSSAPAKLLTHLEKISLLVKAKLFLFLKKNLKALLKARV